MPCSPLRQFPLRSRVSAPILPIAPITGRLLLILFLILFLSQACATQAHAAAGDIKWTCTINAVHKDSSTSSPAIAPDGTIYVGSRNNTFYAITPDGDIKWTFDTGGDIQSSPAIAPDGTIYVGSNDHKLYALSPGGKKKWEFTAGDWVRSSPAIAPNGNLYVGSADDKLYAISPDGHEQWNRTMGDNVFPSPAIAANGTIYATSYNATFYALSPDGHVEWSRGLKQFGYSSPAIAPNGTIYVGSDRVVYALSPNGHQEWNKTVGVGAFSAPVIASNGTIYAAAYDKKLYALSPTDRRVEWVFETGNYLFSSPAIAANGTIYLGARNNALYAISPNGRQEWNCTTGGEIYSSPTIAPDGTIYVGADDGKLYAIDGGDNGGLMENGWPKFRRDLRNTGRDRGRVSALPGQAAAVTFKDRNATAMTSVQIAASYGLGSLTPAATVRAFNATVAPAGATVAFRTAFTGTGKSVSLLRLYKLFDATGTHKAFDPYAAAPDPTTDGTWWITDADGNYLDPDAVSATSREYYYNFVIADDGPYDADKTPGVIRDPTVLVALRDEGESGCVLRPHAASALDGLDWLLLLLAAPALWLLRRRWN